MEHPGRAIVVEIEGLSGDVLNRRCEAANSTCGLLARGIYRQGLATSRGGSMIELAKRRKPALKIRTSQVCRRRYTFERGG